VDDGEFYRGRWRGGADHHLSAILAYSRGFVREADGDRRLDRRGDRRLPVRPLGTPIVKELPVVGDFLSDSCELSVVAAFAAVFAIGLIVAALFTPLFPRVVQRSALGGIDQGLGFLFGVARGILLIAMAFIVYDRALSSQSIPMIDNSRTAKVFANFPGRDRRGDPDRRTRLDRGALQRPDRGLHRPRHCPGSRPRRPGRRHHRRLRSARRCAHPVHGCCRIAAMWG
jgi:membrane protein required for colicin V production